MTDFDSVTELAIWLAQDDDGCDRWPDDYQYYITMIVQVQLILNGK